MTTGSMGHLPRTIRDTLLVVVCACTCIHSVFNNKSILIVYSPYHKATFALVPTGLDGMPTSNTSSTYEYTIKETRIQTEMMLESSTQSATNEETPSERSQPNDVTRINDVLGDASTLNATKPSTELDSKSPRCAINLYGLPRSFSDHVLPSLVKNVIRTNAKHNCDYFIHYYNVTLEESGRSGNGGEIRPDEIHDIRSHILDAAINSSSQTPIIIAFRSHTNDEFWSHRNETVQKVRHTKDINGNYYYFPWKEANYRYPQTTDNIIKMWHSIEAVWKLMKENELAHNSQYDRVAMLRSDLVYMTPIDIFTKANGERDEDNNVVVIPNFAKYPVNDRLVYGPAEAVKVWASERFDRMEDHVNRTFYREYGWGLHSERFVAHALLPVMRQNNFTVEQHPTMCMFRARADQTVLYQDCGRVARYLGGDVKEKLEAVLEQSCRPAPRRTLKCT